MIKLQFFPRLFLGTFVLLLLSLGGVPPILADCDVAAPQLVGFSFSPAVIDVSAGPAGVTCDITLSDALSGVAEATCSFRAPGFLQVQSCTALAPSAGDRNNGVFSCTVDVPRYAESGTWRASMMTTDSAGNTLFVSDAELEFVLFLPVNLTVASTPDVMPPALTSFDFNPKTPDVSGGPVNVTCTAGVTDALAGVNRIGCFFQRPSDEFGYICLAFAPTTGDRNNGTFSCDVTVQQYSEAADWTAILLVYDEVENAAFFDSATLQGLSYPSTLAVTSSPSDGAVPVLTNFDFNPKMLDVASSPGLVTCSVEITDNPAGVDLVSCAFESPGLLKRVECFSTTPAVGSDTNGTFNCNFTIPQYSEGGAWKASLEIWDRVGNLLEEDAVTLAASLYPTDLVVDCGATTTTFSIRFVSKTTIIWDPVPDAFFYNVYRGDLASLGASYGTCQNANDPNPTDTMYDDPEVPAPGLGFAYLVSYRLISGEDGLGTRSDGTPRVVAVPCP
jgi:hypothetical protein